MWQLSDDWLVAAVADGLGGHVGGRRASTLALEMLGTAIHEGSNLDLFATALDIHEALRAEQEQMPALRSMATTLSAIVLTGNVAHTVHCGDSRIALARGRGIVRCTEDHTEAGRFLEAGLLSTAEFKNYPRKNILDSALGIHAAPRVDVNTLEVQVGDRVFLTTDGTHDRVALQELRSMSAKAPSPEDLSYQVKELVGQRRPTDNFSFVALYVD